MSVTSVEQYSGCWIRSLGFGICKSQLTGFDYLQFGSSASSWWITLHPQPCKAGFSCLRADLS